jgi:hypothetical protein
MQKQLKTLTTTAMSRAAGIMLVAMLFMVSCNNNTGDQAIIPIPKDTSALAKIDHFIPVDQIKAYEDTFRLEREVLQKIQPGFFIPFSETFNKQSVIDVLQLKDCVGMRVLYGLTKKGDSSSIRLILVGVNSRGENLYVTKQKQRSNNAAGQVKDAVPGAASGEVDGGEEHGQCRPPCPTSY